MSDKNESSLEEAREINEGFFGGLYNSLRLIGRLLRDHRVSFWLKFLPIGALIYLVFPMDFLPIVPLDDALVVFLGGYLFIELCPQEVVQEHKEGLSRVSQKHTYQNGSSDDIIDANFKEISEIEDQE